MHKKKRQWIWPWNRKRFRQKEEERIRDLITKHSMALKEDLNLRLFLEANTVFCPDGLSVLWLEEIRLEAIEFPDRRPGL